MSEHDLEADSEPDPLRATASLFGCWGHLWVQLFFLCSHDAFDGLSLPISWSPCTRINDLVLGLEDGKRPLPFCSVSRSFSAESLNHHSARANRSRTLGSNGIRTCLGCLDSRRHIMALKFTRRASLRAVSAGRSSQHSSRSSSSFILIRSHRHCFQPSSTASGDLGYPVATPVIA